MANNPTTWVDPSGYSVASLFENDLELLSNLYAMGMGMGDILECMVDEECKNMHALINDLGAQTYNALEWSAEGLYNVFFSTYPHQPTPVSPAAMVFSLTVSNTPVVGDLYDLVTAVTGYDIITGQYLAGWERLVTLIGVIPIPGVSGGSLRHGVDAVESFASHGDDLARVVGGVSDACHINSFSEETPVVTDEGAIPIKDVDVGDRVLAWDELTETTDYYLVTAAFSHVDATIVELTIDGEVVETTADHPFYVVGDADGRWVDAGELATGDAVRKADGVTGVVEAVVVVDTPQRMYNLTVADAHTFFVGDGAWLVHNARCYRVEGTPNLRFNVDSSGNVILIPGKKGMLHLSFGGPGHAEHFLDLKIKGGLPGVHVKEFEVSDDFLDLIRNDALSQADALPGRPQIDDPHIANPLGSEAYGIPATYFEFLIDAILPGSGSIWK